MKITFISKPDEAQFIPSVVRHIAQTHETKEVYTYDMDIIVEAITWADIIWLEWADPLNIKLTQEYSHLFKNKKVLMRVHSYESVCGYILNINWKAVDHVIFVAKYIGDLTFSQIANNKIEVNPNLRLWHIPNGIEIQKYPFEKREGDHFNLAWVGSIFPKKGPMLMIHAMEALVKRDPRYKLFIAGQFNDMRDAIYVDHMIGEMGLKDNIEYTGYQNNIAEWYKDKSFITCFSEFESQNLSLMEGMLTGMVPSIHNFPGAKNIYPDELIWTTIDEFVEGICSIYPGPISDKYRNFVVDNYSHDLMMKKIDILLSQVIGE